MTPRQFAIARAFKNVSFALYSRASVFARAMIHHAETMPGAPISARQWRYMQILAWRYRRQMPADLAYPADAQPSELIIPQAAFAAVALGPIDAGDAVKIVERGAVISAEPKPQRDLFE